MPHRAPNSPVTATPERDPTRIGPGTHCGEVAGAVHEMQPLGSARLEEAHCTRSHPIVAGELVSTRGFQAPDGFPEIYVGAYADGSHALAWIEQTPRDRSVVTPDHMKIGRFGEDGGMSVLLDTAFGMRRLASPLPFSPHFLAAMIGDTVFHTDGLDGAIHVVNPDGERVRVVHVPMDSVAFGEARRRLEPELDSAAVRRIRELHSVSGVDSVPTLAELLADGEGHLWAKRYEPSTDSHWKLRSRTGGEWLMLETDGNVVARVTIPAGVRLVEVAGGRIAGIARDELGVERVQVFALRNEQPAR